MRPHEACSLREDPRKLQCVHVVKMNLSEANHTSTSDFLTFYNGLGTLFGVNLVVGFPANVYMVRLLVSGAGRIVASELFALNLAISEILFGVSSAYLMLHFLLRMAPYTGMLLLQCFIRLMFFSRPIFHSCICVERYLAVVHPTVFLRFKPLRYRLAFCMVNWLLVLLYCTIPTFMLSTTQSVYLLIIKSLFFLVLMFYCGIHVLCVLKQPGPGDGDRARESSNTTKRKAFKVIMITMVFTSTTELLQVLMFSPMLYAPQQVLLWVMLMNMAVNIVSGFITPLLFLHRAGKLPCRKF
ncbi:lysophosphatidic acid receptor 6-like isoform X2 [Thunnus albacares]|nr:lysophosphatidic acid receptor 6-like isoform X2 [Thunnus albacares]